jgi:hypothetical protein
LPKFCVNAQNKKEYTLTMIFAELYFLHYFLLSVLAGLAIKTATKTRARLGNIILFAIIFCVIKFLMDYYSSPIVWQIVVVAFVYLTGLIVVHKPEHSTRLVLCSVVAGSYYLAIVGINAVLGLTLKNISTYNSNRYLLLGMGLNLVVFSLVMCLTQYFDSKTYLALTRQCEITINGKKIALTGFVDTGNRLVDTQTNLPVIIIRLSALKKALSTQMRADLIFATNASGQFEKIKKIRYATVSGTNFMTVFKPTMFCANGKKIDCMVGIICAENMNYDALLCSACL